MFRELPEMENMPIKSEQSSRLHRLYNVDSVYVWSLQLMKLLLVSKADFNGRTLKCKLCIPRYRGYAPNDPTTLCKSKLNSLGQLINHVLSLENVFARQLIWSSKNEIPDNLQREREIGDLSSLENSPILRIEYGGCVLVDYRESIKKFLRLNGCPCKFHLPGPGCKGNAGHSNMNLMSHLSTRERKMKKLIVFKAQETDILADGPLFLDFVPNSNNPPSSSSQSLISSHSENADQTFQSGNNSTFDSRISVSIEESIRSNVSHMNSNTLTPNVSFTSPDNNVPANSSFASPSDIQLNSSTINIPDQQTPAVKRKRGRPLKNRVAQSTSVTSNRVESKIVKIIYEDRSFLLAKNDALNEIAEFKDKKLEFIFNDGIKITETTDSKCSKF